MNLNLIQLISGTATFAEPERTISEATRGTVVSIPEAKWIDLGCPSALTVSIFPGEYENVEKVEPVVKPKVENPYRYGYPASSGGSYL